MDNLAYSDPPVTELIEGKTYLMSPRPMVGHTRVASRIYCIFDNYLQGKPCIAFNDGIDVYLDDKNHYVPDAMIVCDRSIIHRDAIYGAPDLVVEVLSPSTMKHDRGPKMEHYAAAGVKEYWLVAPFEKTIEVYLNRDGRFQLDNIYVELPDWELARMTEEERDDVPTVVKVSLYEDLFVDIKDVFEDIDLFR